MSGVLRLTVSVLRKREICRDPWMLGCRGNRKNSLNRVFFSLEFASPRLADCRFVHVLFFHSEFRLQFAVTESRLISTHTNSRDSRGATQGDSGDSGRAMVLLDNDGVSQSAINCVLR